MFIKKQKNTFWICQLSMTFLFLIVTSKKKILRAHSPNRNIKQRKDVDFSVGSSGNMVTEHLFWSDKEINRIYNVDTDHNLIHDRQIYCCTN